MSNDRLVPPGSYDWTGSKKERAERCFLGKVYMAVAGRNAWHSTWVRRYRSSDSFHATLLAAKRSVEPRRVQGSTWLVRELPAIVISGSKTTSYVFEINNSRPFNFDPPDFGTAVTVFTLINRWSPLPTHQVFQRVASAPQKTTARLPYRIHTSYSRGANSYLGWRRRSNPVLVDGTMSHIKALSSHLQKHL